tara:strand:+ start:11413 stop:11883 length:471 start_codon:yes stop_codon:yes gene_type:complete
MKDDYKVPLHIREKRREYYRENRERILQNKRDYYQKHKGMFNKKNKRLYHENKEYRKQQVRIRQDFILARVRDIKRQRGCEHKGCKVNDPIMLDFDHIDRSTKKFGICQGVNRGIAWTTILEEIGKCQVLCANCHRERTARQTYHMFKAAREAGLE